MSAAGAGFTIDGLKVKPTVGAFGAVPVGSCDLTTYAGCRIKTFTLENVGSSTILIGGFGISGEDPLVAALAPGIPGSGCQFQPIVGGFWTLQPGDSCTIGVAFSPTQRGPVENVLRVWSTDEASPIAVVPLRGVGI